MKTWLSTYKHSLGLLALFLVLSLVMPLFLEHSLLVPDSSLPKYFLIKVESSSTQENLFCWELDSSLPQLQFGQQSFSLQHFIQTGKLTAPMTASSL